MMINLTERLILYAVTLLTYVTVNSTGTVLVNSDISLTFLEKYVTENCITASLYFATVDLDIKKTSCTDRLDETGFINNQYIYNLSTVFADKYNSVMPFHNVNDKVLMPRVLFRCESGCDDSNPVDYSIFENYLVCCHTVDIISRKSLLTMIS